jgi:hypothetical protein
VARDQGYTGGPTLASDGGSQIVSIRFTPHASLADVTRFLDVNRATIVEGPKRGGLYKVRLTTSTMSTEEFNRTVQRMRAETRIVEFIATQN